MNDQYTPTRGHAPRDEFCDAAWEDIMALADKHALIVQASSGMATLALPIEQRKTGIRERVLRTGLFELEEGVTMTIGISKTRPTNNATPLGVTKRSQAKDRRIQRQAQSALEKLVSEEKTHVDRMILDPVASETVASETVSETSTAALMPPTRKESIVATLNYKGLSSSGKIALYAGLRTVTRLSITDFPNSKPPQTLEVTGDLAGPRVAKPKLTAEERKAIQAAKPKPTLAERAAQAEERARKLRAKAQAEAHASM